MILENPRVGYERPQSWGHGLVFFYTDDVDELARFYTDTLGFRLRDGENNEPGHSYWLDTGPVTLVLHQSEPFYIEGPYDHAKSSTLIWVRTDQPIAEVHERTQRAGVKTAGDVNYCLERGLLVIRDIEGRRIGLMGRA